jgi:hypothetical protein
MTLYQISNSFVISGDFQIVGVQVAGTAGNLARYGLAMTDGSEFWDFEPCELSTALHVGE